MSLTLEPGRSRTRVDNRPARKLHNIQQQGRGGAWTTGGDSSLAIQEELKTGAAKSETVPGPRRPVGRSSR
jgi:hypothetical protein